MQNKTFIPLGRIDGNLLKTDQNHDESVNRHAGGECYGSSLARSLLKVQQAKRTAIQCFQTLYDNIQATYPANFIEIIYVVKQIQQFKL